MKRLKFLAIALLLISQLGFAQTDIKGWHLRDPQTDSFYGISLQKAYEFLKGKTYAPVIVAVIDSGVDTTHEDLKKILWTNPREIPGNGIDDDGNGYVDDIHGWNFLGNKDGTNLKKETDERTRVYYRFKDKYSNKTIDSASLKPEELYEYNMWLKAKAAIEGPAEEPDMDLSVMRRAY